MRAHDEPGLTILKAPDLARELRVSQMTIVRMVRRGDLPKPLKLGPKLTGWPREVVMRWICEKFEAANAKSG